MGAGWDRRFNTGYARKHNCIFKFVSYLNLGLRSAFSLHSLHFAVLGPFPIFLKISKTSMEAFVPSPRLPAFPHRTLRDQLEEAETREASLHPGPRGLALGPHSLHFSSPTMCLCKQPSNTIFLPRCQKIGTPEGFLLRSLILSFKYFLPVELAAVLSAKRNCISPGKYLIWEWVPGWEGF